MTDAPTSAAYLAFAAWFRKNYPGPNTSIRDPDWHSPKIWRACWTIVWGKLHGEADPYRVVAEAAKEWQLAHYGSGVADTFVREVAADAALCDALARLAEIQKGTEQ